VSNYKHGRMVVFHLSQPLRQLSPRLSETPTARMSPTPITALTGCIDANVRSLTTAGGIFGPSYLLDGHLALKFALNGTVAKPKLSGTLTGDGLSATLVDRGV